MELKDVLFTFYAHMSMADEHTTTYVSVNCEPRIGICTHTPYVDGQPKGRSFTHYRVNGKTFKTKKSLEDYIKTIELKESCNERS